MQVYNSKLQENLEFFYKKAGNISFFIQRFNKASCVYNATMFLICC